MVYLNLKEIMKQKKITKYWLVINMPSDYKSVGNMIEGKTTSIKFKTIDRLCELLECTPGDIIKVK